MSVLRPGLGRTINVDTTQRGSHGPIRANTIPAVRRRGKSVVAQWFTVDIAAVEYTQTQIQLAVGEPLRIAHKHRPLSSEWPALGAGQQIVSRSGRVNDEDSTITIMKDRCRVGERRFQCAFKAFVPSIRQVSAISHAYCNDTNLQLQDCLLDESNPTTFVVIVLSLPACVSRLPQQCQPLHAVPNAVSQCRQADHGHSAQKPRHLNRIGATSTGCNNLPLEYELPKDSFLQSPWRLASLREAKHLVQLSPQISISRWAKFYQMRVILTFGETHACLPFLHRCSTHSSQIWFAGTLR